MDKYFFIAVAIDEEMWKQILSYDCFTNYLYKQKPRPLERSFDEI